MSLMRISLVLFDSFYRPQPPIGDSRSRNIFIKAQREFHPIFIHGGLRFAISPYNFVAQ
jgi:hypothetical protein